MAKRKRKPRRDQQTPLLFLRALAADVLFAPMVVDTDAHPNGIAIDLPDHATVKSDTHVFVQPPRRKQ